MSKHGFVESLKHRSYFFDKGIEVPMHPVRYMLYR